MNIILLTFAVVSIILITIQIIRRKVIQNIIQYFESSDIFALSILLAVTFLAMNAILAVYALSILAIQLTLLACFIITFFVCI